MNWADLHGESEKYAEAAHIAQRAGDGARASDLFAAAAKRETEALSSLPQAKPRTYGITAVSAVSLWYKAGELMIAEKLAHRASNFEGLPDFAADQLRTLLQAIWNELAQREAGVSFAPGQVLVSVRGGEVVKGGAPLDLVVDKAQSVQRMFYRTVEFLQGVPLRKSGPPPRDLQERCRPWLFQSVPGSYQFSVAIQKPRQSELFGDPFPDAEKVTDAFLSILRAASDAPETELVCIVQEPEYRDTFLKMARNLSPTGKSFSEMEIKAAGETRSVVLTTASRKVMSGSLRATKELTPKMQDSGEIEIRGILRALNLDKDWLEVTIDGQHKRVVGVSETVDDVIGPMVNHAVVVRVRADSKGVLHFLDIEREE